MAHRFCLTLLGIGMVLGPSTSAIADPGECRAGCPQKVAWYACPTEAPQYIGYYVGGGQAVGGRCRCPEEGTWGWDYHGLLLPHRVLLYRSQESRYQGGTGAYKTDGPHIPDVPALLHSAAHAPFGMRD
jgi:hypothetical protein